MNLKSHVISILLFYINKMITDMAFLFCVKIFQKLKVNPSGLGWRAGESRKNLLSEFQAFVSLSVGDSLGQEKHI